MLEKLKELMKNVDPDMNLDNVTLDTKLIDDLLSNISPSVIINRDALDSFSPLLPNHFSIIFSSNFSEQSRIVLHTPVIAVAGR